MTPTRKTHPYRRTLALILALQLCATPARAGIPTIDWTGIITTTQQSLQDAMMWGQQFEHWQTQFQQWSNHFTQWKNNFQEQIRGVVQGFGIKKFDATWDENTYINLIKESKKDCAKIGLAKSRTLCIEMADIRIDKIKLYYESYEVLNTELEKLEALVKKRNDLASKSTSADSSANNSGEVEAAEERISQQLQTIQMLHKSYDLKDKQLDADYEFRRQARVELAQRQLQGSDLGRTVTSIATGKALDSSADSWRKQADSLRDETQGRSNNAFHSNGTLGQ